MLLLLLKKNIIVMMTRINNMEYAEVLVNPTDEMGERQ